jgi:hypothetical protein
LPASSPFRYRSATGSDLTQWIRRVLTVEGFVVNKTRPKHNFRDRDLTRLLVTPWTANDLIFIPERYRVQFTFIVRVYCWIGARIGALFHRRASIQGWCLPLTGIETRST